MNLSFHPAVQQDINEVLNHYAERSETAADRFWEAFHSRLQQIAANPTLFGFINEKRGLRRVKLAKFPYLVIYYQTATGVRICAQSTAAARRHSLHRRNSLTPTQISRSQAPLRRVNRCLGAIVAFLSLKVPHNPPLNLYSPAH